jgi:exopolysaccharide biosynthesis polyprenyl glycosylphosphotransferase
MSEMRFFLWIVERIHHIWLFNNILGATVKAHLHLGSDNQRPIIEPLTQKDDSALQFELRDSRLYGLFKRLFDLLIGSVCLILLIPVFPIIALMIKLDSRGPVLYKQVRVGKEGRRFKFYKFRSMVHNADTFLDQVIGLNEQDGPIFKIKADPRITAVGQFLRRSSLDEIPQIFNVINGDMSIVGPRPPLPTEVAGYQPWHRRRLEVKPGITCLWQISGRSHISFNEWMRLDLEYLKNRSIKTDFLILLKTLPAVIARKGAY